MRFVSAIDPVSEARLQASAIPYGAPEAYCYGVGNGELVRACLQRAKLLHVVKVCEEWDRNVRLPAGNYTVERATPETLLYAGFAHSPMEVFCADPPAWGLRDRIHVLANDPLNRIHQQRITTIASSRTQPEFADPPVSELFSPRFDAVTVCAGGPTLSAQCARIQALGLTVIAASTALRPLQQAGIFPAFTVCVDGIIEQFESIDATGVLVYQASVDPRIPVAWRGQRYAIAEGELFQGGSVVHGAVDLAVRMGARTINLAGADFGYPGQQSHVSGSAEPLDLSQRGRLRTMNGHGVPIRTDQNLCQYRVFLEHYIGLHPEVRFVKLGREGAVVRRMEWDV